jgi:predicted DNA-binding protein (UPF0251 family)
MVIETGSPGLGRESRFLASRFTGAANRFAGYQPPEGEPCRLGEASFSASPEPSGGGFGVIRDIAHKGEEGMLVDRFRYGLATRMPISTMTKRVRVKGIQRHLAAEGQSTIPSGVMQAVLMHALQLRRSCREVFLLCDIQRHSISEAAEILGISRAAANKRLRMARQRMNEVIERLCVPHHKPAVEIQMNEADVSFSL